MSDHTGPDSVRDGTRPFLVSRACPGRSGPVLTHYLLSAWNRPLTHSGPQLLLLCKMRVSWSCELRSDARQEHDGVNGIGMQERPWQDRHRRELVSSETKGKEDIKSKLIIITLFIKGEKIAIM